MFEIHIFRHLGVEFSIGTDVILVPGSVGHFLGFEDARVDVSNFHKESFVASEDFLEFLLRKGANSSSVKVLSLQISMKSRR